MGIKLHELKRKKIKWTKDGIEVYNPSPEEKEELIKMLIPYMDEVNQLIGVPYNDVIKLFLPKLSNIDLVDEDLNPEELDEYINDVIDDMSENLKHSIKVVEEIIQKLINEVVGNVADLLDMENADFAKALDITEDAAKILRAEIDIQVNTIEGN